jgi:hypothetical protein
MSGIQGVELDSFGRESTGVRTARYLTAFAAFVFLAACVSSGPVPELIASATPKPETPATVTGELLQACKKAARLSDSVTLDTEATYNPGYTYKMAERIHRLLGDPATAEYAQRVRAYVASWSGRNILGMEMDRKLACFYELDNGQLRFLSAVIADEKDRGSSDSFSSAVMTAYAVLSGKDRTQVLLFGAYAK